ncbi:hypothetical protein EMPS_05254 [Entomortierella parvispora]|uniref:F-box domain-containing protein n=1 Tax=Entomortierella parvispora TaxID=205924 RepID=A0A9P3LW61_9FUNG|nr:hypothetical protein EMPS_05254 [Entomortierella parvispora]
METTTGIGILHLPTEVLELVCQQLSQATLRSSARLVSKLWNVICTRYIHRTVVWTPLSVQNDQRLLEALQTRGSGQQGGEGRGGGARVAIHSLECRIQPDNLKDFFLGLEPKIPGPMTMVEKVDAWKAFLQLLLTTPYELLQDDKDDQQNSRLESQDHGKSRPCVMDKMRRLRFYCSQFTPIRAGIEQALAGSHFGSLQTLEIRIQVKVSGPQEGGLDLVSAFEEENEEAELTWGPRPYFNPKRTRLLAARAAIQKVTRQPQDPDLGRERQYRLEVLDLIRVNARQEDLERIAHTCPYLQIFRTIDFLPGLRTKSIVFKEGEAALLQRHARKSLLEKDGILQHFKASCPLLSSCEVIPKTWGLGLTYSRRLFRHSLILPHLQSVTLCSAHREMDDAREEEAYDSDEEEGFYYDRIHWPLSDESGFQTVGFLSRLTTLEIQRTSFFAFYSRLLNQLLCLTPNLLHCIAAEECFSARLLNSESDLTTTTATATATTSEQETTRWIYGPPSEEQNESSATLEDTQNDGQEPGFAVSTIQVPKVWQCRLLRTLHLRVRWNHSASALSLIGIYVKQHQLFQKLTFLQLFMTELHLGQCKRRPPEPGKEEAQAAVVVPRYRNDLETFHDLLPSLEEFKLEGQHLNGFLQASDFEFLRRRLDTEKSEDGGCEDNKNGNRVQSCRWPWLQMFVIRVAESPVSDYSAVIAGMEEIRPGVEFSIGLSPPMYFTKDQ